MEENGEELSMADQALMNRNWEKTNSLWQNLTEDMGFILIRLKPTSKEPLEPRWGNKVKIRPYERIGLQPSMNAGIVCGAESGLIVLDVDDPQGFDELGLEVPGTFTVKTGKGYHYYFKMPQGNSELYRNRSKGTYDIRATKGYVVAPGSVHSSGTIYKVSEDSRPVDPPQWLLDISKADERSTQRIRNLQGQSGVKSSHFEDLEEVDLDSLNIGATLRDHILNGHPAGADRSKLDFGVTVGLLKAGCTDSQIKWIFTEYPISEKSDEHADKYGYLQTTIENAFEAVSDEIELSVADQDWNTVKIPDEAGLDIAFQRLAEYASRDLRGILEEHRNTVTPQRNKDLRKLVLTYCAMANRKLQGRIAFPLPTGYGKTTSIIAFLSRASKMDMLGFSEKESRFSIAITAFKVEELCSLYNSLIYAGVPEEMICLCHSYKYRADYLDKDGNVLKVGYASVPATHVIDPKTGKPKLDENKKPTIDTRRPILLLTHNKTKVSGGHDFDSLIDGRTMLIWDETMLSTEAGAVSVMKVSAAISHLDTIAKSMTYSIRDTSHLNEAVEVETVQKTAQYLSGCIQSVWDEISRQVSGAEKRVLRFDSDCELSHEDMLEVISDLIENERDESVVESLTELRSFARVTMYEASVDLDKSTDNHMVVRFDIVMPDSVENIVVLDASTWINILMKLDKSIAIPEGIKTTLSYEGTVIHRIDFNSGRTEVTRELQTNEQGLLDVIEEIVCNHPDESILFFTFKEKDNINSQALIESHLSRKGHDVHASVGQHLRFNWMTHGNYTASNQYSHCTVMIFVGMLHKPQHVYRTQIIAQTRDLTTTITKADESRVKEAGHATDAHQGINRGAGRIIRGNTTQPVNAYYTYLSDNLVEDLKAVMPKIEHRIFETEVLQPKTQLAVCIRATKKYLLKLIGETTKVSKATLNKQIPEMAEAHKRMRDRVSVAIDKDLSVPWRTDSRSWVYLDEPITASSQL